MSAFTEIQLIVAQLLPELRDDLVARFSDRMELTFNLIAQELPKLSDQRFFESSNLRFEFNEINSVKARACGDAKWQRFFLLQTSLWYRFASAYPDFSVRSLKSHMRWISRQIKRLPNKRERRMVWQYLQTPFEPGPKRDHDSTPLCDLQPWLQKLPCECQLHCRFQPDRWCAEARRAVGR